MRLLDHPDHQDQLFSVFFTTRNNTSSRGSGKQEGNQTKMSEERVKPITLYSATNAEEVEECLKRGDDIEKRNRKGDTPLLSAIKRGNKEVLDALIRHGAQVVIQGDWMKDPMTCACREGQTFIVQRLLQDERIDINNVPQYFTPPLMVASSQGHVDIVELLLERGAHVDYGTGEGTALKVACLEGHVDVVDRLLAAGADVNISDWQGFTPLMNAAEIGHLGIVDRLILFGADVNALNEEGDSALKFARIFGHKQVVDRLLSVCAEDDLHSSV